MVADLEHWQHDTFKGEVAGPQLECGRLCLLRSEAGCEYRADVKMAAVSPLTDFSFDFHDLLFTREDGSGEN
jgi:hypothetical protein